jgi:tryptophan halogenase
MKKSISKIAVVGGGTAGLISALILKKRFPHIVIDVIYSGKIGIIGVGEGSTEHFRHFMDYVGIDQYEIIKNCDATYKMGILFDNWSEEQYLHSLQTPYVQRFGEYNFLFAKLIGENSKSCEMSSPIYWGNQVNLNFLNKSKEFFSNQFHFNTFKLNEFLIDKSKLMGINFYDDEVKDIVINEDGSVTKLIGEKREYMYDFYIDSTGFKRMLISKLNAKWISFGEYLKMKSAVVFPTGDTDNYNIWTVARAMNYGWLFRIPVWGRHGNGYIYDSDYISEDEAHREIENIFGGKIDIGRSFKFDPGMLEKVWIKNCCAIGLSGSFVEPLEATSIGTSIQQSFLLMNKIINYNDQTIKEYNRSFENIMINIRDFIILHYITKKTDTKFWIDAANLTLPDTLKEKLELWRHKLPIREDFNNFSNYILFTEDNFSMVMQGLKLFDTNSINLEYQSLPIEIKSYAEKILIDETNYITSIKTLNHKDYLRIIREIL